MNETNDPFQCGKRILLHYLLLLVLMLSLNWCCLVPAAKGNSILSNQYQLYIALEHNNNLFITDI